MNRIFHIVVIGLVTFGTSALDLTAGEISGPVTGGSQGPFCAPAFDVGQFDYVVEEYFLEGQASAYKFSESSSQTADGKWSTERREETAPYRSRILVVRPEKQSDFNGTVIVHWQNVTAGYELGTVTEGEHLRGFAWVGVSAQKIGIHGFPGPDAAGLKQSDPERYGSLDHPGDGYSYDIFNQAARAVGPDRSGEIDPMGGLKVERLVAAGASQSAGRLRTYINGVHPIEKVFHGFIPYIDFGGTIPFDSDFGGQRRRGRRSSTVIREDLDVPVLVLNSETETTAYVGARQPDTDTFRFWEVAGTSHVSVPRGEEREGLESANWHSYLPVYASAIRHMHHWIADGVDPPKMPSIELETGDTPALARDENGNAKGGIRLPEFAVPTATHSGAGKQVPGGSRFGFLYGSAEDFSAKKLAELYPTPDDYMKAYDAALSASVEQGAILAEDRPQLRAAAQAWAARLEPATAP